MKTKPMNNRVIVKPEVATTTSKGGIVLVAEVEKGKTIQGKIVAIGKGQRFKDGSTRTLDVQLGDIAVFEKSVGHEVTLEGEKLIIICEADILAVITK